ANLFFVYRGKALTHVFTWVTLLGKAQVMGVFVAAALALLWMWGKRHCMLPLLAAIAGSEGFTYLGKLAFHRPRPEWAVYAETSFSFPSGHATIAMAFFGFVGYLLVRAAHSWKQKVNILFAALFLILAIGFSRIYLGEHYLSDVWSGFLVGAMWVVIAVTFCEWRSREQKNADARPPVSGARAFTFILILGAVLFYTGFSIWYQPPAARHPEQKVSMVGKSTDIFTGQQRRYTETLLGEKQEPLNFIFIVRHERQLASLLHRAGWKTSRKASFAALIKTARAWLLKQPYPAAPVSPTFWNARIQGSGYAKATASSGFGFTRHIRLWRTHDQLKDGSRIYVGLVNATNGFKWGIIPRLSPDLDADREVLFRDLEGTGELGGYRKTQLVGAQTGTNFIGERFFTDGKAYIVYVKDF
ncbi:MAG: LssY C-terminal domain-containing protein, partial [Desulfosarcinaceae bacterium]